MSHDIYSNPTAEIPKHSHLVTVDVAVKRAHRSAQARAVRTPVLVSKLEHLHCDRYIYTTVNNIISFSLLFINFTHC